MKLERPLVVFDLETTGTNINTDRIVEISVLKAFPDGTVEQKCRRINPGMPIPPEATAVHHISDEDVANEPQFREIARSLFEYFEGCDVAGFNSNKFDVPLLVQEFERVGLNFDVVTRKFVDVQNIFHKMEKRTLAAAYKFYCNADLEGAHSALADTRATYEVLLRQVEMYDELGDDIQALSDFSKMDRALDLAGRIVLNDQDEPVFNFGKNKGRTVQDVVKREPGFIAWIMQGDFPKNTKDVLLGLQLKYRGK